MIKYISLLKKINYKTKIWITNIYYKKIYYTTKLWILRGFTTIIMVQIQIFVIKKKMLYRIMNFTRIYYNNDRVYEKS